MHRLAMQLRQLDVGWRDRTRERVLLEMSTTLTRRDITTEAHT